LTRDPSIKSLNGKVTEDFNKDEKKEPKTPLKDDAQ